MGLPTARRSEIHIVIKNCKFIFSKQIKAFKKYLTKLILDFCNSKATQIFTNKSLSFEKLKKFKLLYLRFAVNCRYYLVDLIT